MENLGFLKSRKNIAIIASLIIIAAVTIFMSSNFMGSMEQNQESGASTAVLETNQGTIKIELLLGQSPVTAGNFKKLVEEGFYDGTRFHRVIDGFMIQGGDPNSRDVGKMGMWGTGNPGYAIKDEFAAGLSNIRGTISMANSGPNSGGSQFFINVADNVNLDGRHPVFGKVVGGMEVVDSISKSETTGSPYDRPVEDVIVTRAFME
jgi:peptidylprolyl isomerase